RYRMKPGDVTVADDQAEQLAGRDLTVALVVGRAFVVEQRLVKVQKRSPYLDETVARHVGGLGVGWLDWWVRVARHRRPREVLPGGRDVRRAPGRAASTMPRLSIRSGSPALKLGANGPKVTCPARS